MTARVRSFYQQVGRSLLFSTQLKRSQSIMLAQFNHRDSSCYFVVVSSCVLMFLASVGKQGDVFCLLVCSCASVPCNCSHIIGSLCTGWGDWNSRSRSFSPFLTGFKKTHTQICSMCPCYSPEMGPNNLERT